MNVLNVPEPDFMQDEEITLFSDRPAANVFPP